jgi:hypothetical protein
MLHGPDVNNSLVRASERDLGTGRVMTVPPREFQNRAVIGLWSLEDFAYELGADRSWRSPDHVLRTGDLVVERAGQSLLVRHLVTGRTFDVILFFEAYLAMMAIGGFKPAPPGAHVPRVTIDGVVVSREHWRFDAAELPVLGDDSHGAEAFVIVRGWAREVGLPRWVFVKIPEQPKPVYIDFASPVYVDMFCKLMREASAMSISEMLPSIEDSWLPDAEGQTYTCELRMVAVDPVAWIDPLGR